jgi:hypothetical protein
VLHGVQQVRAGPSGDTRGDSRQDDGGSETPKLRGPGGGV